MDEADTHLWVLAPGDRVGEWRVSARFGRGGMGEVYAVEDVRTGERFALKLFTAQGGMTISCGAVSATWARR